MISVIICAREIDDTLAEQVRRTIGVPYELIVIDNCVKAEGICAVYNRGVSRANYEILCFMHDDVTYHTINWGRKVVAHFKDPKVSAICIAGSPFRSYLPGAWWGSGQVYRHLLQGNGHAEGTLVSDGIPGVPRQIVVADGVWFCIRKACFDKVRFNETNFPGFHFYDNDIFMQLFVNRYLAYCINDITIHHASLGNVDRSWVEAALTFQRCWKAHLPASCAGSSYVAACRSEYRTLNSFIWACSANGWSNARIYRMALRAVLTYRRGLLFYKTPGYVLKFLYKALFKKGLPF